MARKRPEWLGSSPDAKVPPRVRLRIWEREGGRCHLSGRKIMPGEPWDLDHKVALINGGEHRESNLFPALRDKHREKTKADVAEKARVSRKRKKHLGIDAVKTNRWQSRGFPKAEARIKELEQALEPFSTVGRMISTEPFGPALFPDEKTAFDCAWVENGKSGSLSWGDFRRARAVKGGEG